MGFNVVYEADYVVIATTWKPPGSDRSEGVRVAPKRHLGASGLSEVRGWAVYGEKETVEYMI